MQPEITVFITPLRLLHEGMDNTGSLFCDNCTSVNNLLSCLDQSAGIGDRVDKILFASMGLGFVQMEVDGDLVVEIASVEYVTAEVGRIGHHDILIG